MGICSSKNPPGRPVSIGCFGGCQPKNPIKKTRGRDTARVDDICDFSYPTLEISNITHKHVESGDGSVLPSVFASTKFQQSLRSSVYNPSLARNPQFNMCSVSFYHDEVFLLESLHGSCVLAKFMKVELLSSPRVSGVETGGTHELQRSKRSKKR